MTSRRKKPAAFGFTLIELMIVVGIIAVISTLAVGLTTDWRRRNVFNTVTREIYGTLNRARGTAIKRGSRVTVQIDDNPERVTAFVDANHNNSFEPATESVIYQFPLDQEDWPSGVWGIKATIDTTILGANLFKPVLIFDASGFHVDVNGDPLAGTITVNDLVLEQNNYVDVTIAGALRIR